MYKAPFNSVNTVKKFKTDKQIITGFCIMHKKTIVYSLLGTSKFKSIIVKENSYRNYGRFFKGWLK